jgi:hypothetical protein
LLNQTSRNSPGSPGSPEASHESRNRPWHPLDDAEEVLRRVSRELDATLGIVRLVDLVAELEAFVDAIVRHEIAAARVDRETEELVRDDDALPHCGPNQEQVPFLHN